MTAPDLVEVVAGVLAQHAVPTWGANGKFGGCFCGEPLIAELPTIHARTRALSAHQARAVLDALTEAGNVEWGVAWKGVGPSGVLAFDSEEDAREAVELGGLLSRLTFPWTAAE